MISITVLILIKIGDIVTLIGPRGKFIVKVSEDMQNIKGLGVLDTGKLLDKEFGNELELVDQKYIILQPSLFDKLESIRRKAQIILPKDALQLVGMCDIHSGSVVIEGGAGSGALTIVLANFVAPSGKVITYENRQDFAEIAKRNLRRTNVDKYVELKIADVTNGFDERDVDAIILDIPNPWDAVGHSKKALRPGGFFAAYVPTMNQVEKFVLKLKENKFNVINTIETIQREIVIGPGGVRPSFDMLGHTGYISVARKIVNSY
jgi:tRNA (adenine57-N1/adenine58-N1)-methyltransferase